MSVSVLLPVAYLLVGALAARIGLDARAASAAILSKYVIPAVVAYNIATSQPGLFVVVAGMMLAMLLGLFLSVLSSGNTIASLCFYYLNIGWLGLPVASAAFGDDAARLFVAAYIGSSIFGNAVASGQLGDHAGLAARLWRVVVSPTALGLYAGLAARPFAAVVAAHGTELYAVLKWSMSFLGMAVLGMWLPSQSLRRAEFVRACRLYVVKSAFWLAIGALSVAAAGAAGFTFVSENAAAIGLMALLPPAANIIVLETHYRGTGESSALIVWETVLGVVAILAYVATSAFLRQMTGQVG